MGRYTLYAYVDDSDLHDVASEIRIAARTGRTFIIGIEDSETSVADDIFYVEDADPDIDELRAVIGVTDP